MRRERLSDCKPRNRRRAAAAAELALLLPVLCYICVITIDYSRLFFAWTTIAVCAYDGAYYYSHNPTATTSAISTAATSDATNLTSSALTVTPGSGTDTAGNAYVEVNVAYVFTTQFSYPGIPTSSTISRKLRMPVTPS